MLYLMRQNKLNLKNFKKLNKIDKEEVWNSNNRWKRNKLNGKKKLKLLQKQLKNKSDSNIFKKD